MAITQRAAGEYAIRIEKLEKRYGDTHALKGLSFSVKPGELFGLIGPDGAGKTSLIRILGTLVLADGGYAEVLGHEVVKDYRKIRQKMGYMPGRFSLYQDLTIKENLNLFATIFGTTLEENYELIREIYVQIEPFKNRRAGALSGGMKQKLALCCALIHAPEVLFLDEPTTGVDAVSRKEFWEMLGRLKSKGITMLVSTPYMDEASLCDRVALIQEGEILQVDTPDAIEAAFPRSLYGITGADTYSLLLAMRADERTASVHAFGDSVHFTAKEAISAASLQSMLSEKGFADGVEVKEIRANIEDCFMELMSGGRLADEEISK